MILSCRSCSKRFELRDEALPAEGVRARCPGCGHVFIAFASSGPVEPPPRPAATAAGSEGSPVSRSVGDLGVVSGRPPVSRFVAVSAGPSTGGQSCDAPHDGAERAPAAAEAPRWRLRGAGETEVLLQKAALVQMIRKGDLLQDDLLLPEGSEEWVSAGELAELDRYFQLKEASSGAAGARKKPARGAGSSATPVCASHPEREAEFLCAACPRFLCSSCVTEARYATAVVRLCPACGEPCQPLGKVRSITPFWQDMAGVLKYPVTGWGPVMMIFYAAIALLAALAPLGFLLTFFLLTYNMLIVQASAGGLRSLPDWPDFTSWWEIIGRGIKAVVVTVVSLLPLIAVNVAAHSISGGMVRGPASWLDVRAAASLGLPVVLAQLLAALFFLFYYPMALGITSVFNTIAPILNPALVLKAVGRVPKEYAWVVGFFVASGLVEAVLSVVLEAGVPVLGRVVASIGWAYVTFVQMHVLGWTLYQTEDRLNWDIAI